MTLVQQRLQRFIGGCGYLDEDRLTVGAPVHAVEHQAVKVNVEVGGRPVIRKLGWISVTAPPSACSAFRSACSAFRSA